jgi:branched-chain amino acid aminotransferase
LSVVWLNGKFTNGTLLLDAHDRGFLLGDGVFETIAVINHRTLWLDEHLGRMAHAAGELGIPFDSEALRNGVAVVLQKSQSRLEILRLTLSRGVTVRGLAGEGSEPSLLITLDAFATKNLFQPCRLKVSTIRRNEFAPSSRLKTLSYVDGIMAAREVADDADDALMLNTRGHVASSTVANIFVLKNGELITPALDQGVLAGITRRVLLDGTAKTAERAVHLTDLFSAGAVFLSNSLRFMRPVSHINGESLVTGSLDGLKDVLCGLAQKQCGIDPRGLI